MERNRLGLTALHCRLSVQVLRSLPANGMDSQAPGSRVDDLPNGPLYSMANNDSVEIQLTSGE